MMKMHIRLRNRMVLFNGPISARSLFYVEEARLRGDKYQSMKLCQGQKYFLDHPTRHKQREHRAWSPSRKGPGSTERGAPAITTSTWVGGEFS